MRLNSGKIYINNINNDNNMNIENTHIKLYGKWNNENNEVFDNIFQCKFTNILNKSADELFFKIKPFLFVSGNPPLLEVMGIHPCAADSIGSLPSGSDHFEGAIEINAFL